MISICFILFLLISILSSSYGQVTCASGWVQNGGSCYLIKPAFNSGSISGTWDQCNAYCPTSYPGATMLCVNNAAENEWIRSQTGGIIFGLDILTCYHMEEGKVPTSKARSNHTHKASDEYYTSNHTTAWNTTFVFPAAAIDSDAELFQRCNRDFSQMSRLSHPL